MKAFFEQNSPILQPGVLDDALSDVIETSLEEYDAEVKKHQLLGAHTGVVRNVKVNGASLRHQSSRVGESPAPLSNQLINSTEIEQFSPVSGELRVEAPHGVILVEQLNRDILETPEREYDPRLQAKVLEAVNKLI